MRVHISNNIGLYAVEKSAMIDPYGLNLFEYSKSFKYLTTAIIHVYNSGSLRAFSTRRA